MKRILTILLLLTCAASYAQKPSSWLGTLNNMVEVRSDLKVDSILFLPQRDTNFTPYREGAVIYKQSDSTLYYWAQYWRPMGGSFVKSIYKRNDSLFYQKDGSELFVAKWGLNAIGLPVGLQSTRTGDSLSITTPLNGLVGADGTGFITATIDSPLYYNSGAIGMYQAGIDRSGYLSYQDWKTFNDKLSSSRQVTGVNSVTGGGALTQDRTYQLVNDELAPPPLSYYGTNQTGTKGFFPIPGAVDSVYSVHGRTGHVSAQEGDYSSFYALRTHSHLGLLPIGGSTGQVLKKKSNDDYDVVWENDNMGSGGGGSGGGVDTLARMGDSLMWRKNLTDYFIPDAFKGRRYVPGNGIAFIGDTAIALKYITVTDDSNFLFGHKTNRGIKWDFSGTVGFRFGGDQQGDTYTLGAFGNLERVAPPISITNPVKSYDYTNKRPYWRSGVFGSGLANKIAFWTDAGTLSYSTNFHWDNTNSRLGIGTTAPERKLHIKGDAILIERSGYDAAVITVQTDQQGTLYEWIAGSDSSGSYKISIREHTDVPENDSARLYITKAGQIRFEGYEGIGVRPLAVDDSGWVVIGSGSGTDSASFHSITQINDSTFTLNRRNGTADTIQISFNQAQDGITQESDPVFSAHVANGITSDNINNWDTAYSWGNHSGLYRPISYVPTWSEVTGKPTFATVATSGSYNDLSDKPTIPTNNSQLTNGAGYLTNITGKIAAGTNVTISGDGASTPYTINATASGGGVTISNNADNRVVTGDGTNANAEANLTFNGNTLSVTNSTNASGIAITTLSLTDQPAMNLNGPLTTTVDNGKLFQFKAGSESFGRGMFYSDGSYAIGPGNAARDVYLHRSAANTLKISSNKSTGTADLEVTGKVTTSGIKGAGTAPSVTLDALMGTTSGLTVTGNNLAGRITFTTGSDASSGGGHTPILVLNFGTTYTSSPYAIVTAGNVNAAELKLYSFTSSAGLTINAASDLAPSTQYSFNYIIIQ